jgi:hypothetical protein
MPVNTDIVIEGGCHCRALRFQLQWPRPDDGVDRVTIAGRRCSCSFCTRIGGVWTSHPDARLTIREDPVHPATRYRFATGTADFLFCGRCGISPLVTCEMDGQIYAVVNVNTFDESSENEYTLDVSGSCFDGESTDERLDRRKVRWISRVDWASE